MKKIIFKFIDYNKIHLLVWTVFIIYETAVIGIIFKNFGNPLTYAVHYAVIIFFFYFHANLVLPWALQRKEYSWWRVPVGTIVCLSGYIIFQFGADKLLISTHILHEVKGESLDYQFILKNLYRGIYFIGFSTGYFFLKKHIKSNKERERLEQQHLNNIIKQQRTEQELSKAQNAFLRAQINPHFLFNTLDFIYHNINTEANKASEAIIILSKMMRYAVDSDKAEAFILFDEEIEQVENLLYLYQLRKNNELAIELNYTPEVRNIRIIPFVLLTLVENMIKHGELSSANHTALINMHIDEKELYIETDNLINQVQNYTGTHAGLKNIDTRLKYAYGDQLTFINYTDDRNHFITKLKIPVEKIRTPDKTSAFYKDIDRLLPHEYADQK
jgi:two-component system, LytTR family, sensor kinase